jgi:hypothetical protein
MEKEGVLSYLEKSGRIRQHVYGDKAGILKKGMGRKVGRSAYN